VLVHVEVAIAAERQVKTTMARKEFQHVVKETYASGNLIASLALNPK